MSGLKLHQTVDGMVNRATRIYSLCFLLCILAFILIWVRQYWAVIHLALHSTTSCRSCHFVYIHSVFIHTETNGVEKKKSCWTRRKERMQISFSETLLAIFFKEMKQKTETVLIPKLSHHFVLILTHEEMFGLKTRMEQTESEMQFNLLSIVCYLINALKGWKDGRNNNNYCNNNDTITRQRIILYAFEVLNMMCSLLL